MSERGACRARSCVPAHAKGIISSCRACPLAAESAVRPVFVKAVGALLARAGAAGLPRRPAAPPVLRIVPAMLTPKAVVRRAFVLHCDVCVRILRGRALGHADRFHEFDGCLGSLRGINGRRVRHVAFHHARRFRHREYRQASRRRRTLDAHFAAGKECRPAGIMLLGRENGARQARNILSLLHNRLRRCGSIAAAPSVGCSAGAMSNVASGASFPAPAVLNNESGGTPAARHGGRPGRSREGRSGSARMAKRTHGAWMGQSGQRQSRGSVKRDINYQGHALRPTGSEKHCTDRRDERQRRQRTRRSTRT